MQVPPPMPTLTPNEAVKRTGRSRRTIMRAIEAREIEAHRDNRNRWRISEGALAQWALSEQPMPAAHLAPIASEAVLQERIRALETLLAEMRVTTDDLRADRNAWRTMAQRPWWKRLAG